VKYAESEEQKRARRMKLLQNQTAAAARQAAQLFAQLQLQQQQQQQQQQVLTSDIISFQTIHSYISVKKYVCILKFLLYYSRQSQHHNIIPLRLPHSPHPSLHQDLLSLVL
jgi:fucose permease